MTGFDGTAELAIAGTLSVSSPTFPFAILNDAPELSVTPITVAALLSGVEEIVIVPRVPDGLFVKVMKGMFRVTPVAPATVAQAVGVDETPDTVITILPPAEQVDAIVTLRFPAIAV